MKLAHRAITAFFLVLLVSYINSIPTSRFTDFIKLYGTSSRKYFYLVDV